MEQRIELKPNCSLKPAGALLFFVGCGVLFTVCNVTLDYSRRLPV